MINNLQEKLKNPLIPCKIFLSTKIFNERLLAITILKNKKLKENCYNLKLSYRKEKDYNLIRYDITNVIQV